ncbi:MAG: DEAD/DEAH box helicase [Firmicutes bacterium]|nr:DEAD/DEAH box helicase [Bacillota bacterium]
MNPEFAPHLALGENGLFAAQWPAFEYRPAQQEMSALVWTICRQGGYALIEAGTGTGKSLAYLYPIYLTFQENKNTKGPVIISTHTINLQQQLIEKEIPFLSKTLGFPLQAAVLLGRSNYLCWRKLQYYHQNPDLLPDELKNRFARVYRSAAHGIGCLEQLGYTLSPDLKGKITSESATCLRKHCPFQEQCFWLAARKKAFSAQIVIVNHHLFFTDLALRQAGDFSADGLVLPPYQLVIFDEAHHLPEVAAEHLGARLDQNEINHFCHRLLHREGKWGYGWLPSLRQRLTGKILDLAKLQRLIGVLEHELLPGLLNLENDLNTFFTALGQVIDLTSTFSPEEENKKRFTANLLFEPALQALVAQLQEKLDQWTGHLSRLVDELAEEEDFREDFYFLAETGLFFTKIAALLPRLLDGSDEHYVSWLNLRADRGGENGCYTLNRVPLNLGTLLYQQLFSQVEGAVLTSATLTVEGDFGYIKEQLGMDLLSEARCHEAAYDSPFDYENNVLVLTGEDLPSPDDPEYLPAITELLPLIIQAAGGRSLLLFTNRRQMDLVYTAIMPALTRAGFHLLRQGEEPRHRLLRKFQTTDQAVLMGMDSFWEGVDIPGPQLSNVVIMRLPFRVPTEPLFEAKWEALAREGRDPFLRLSLPEAVIKFKQGFGRLIRSQNDRGVVVVLDQRIITKRYGQVFLGSLPGGKIVSAPRMELPQLIEKWLAKSG